MARLRPLLGVLALTVLLAARALPDLAENHTLACALGLPGMALAAAQCAAPALPPGRW